jgi:hypothetical protein
LEALFYYNWSRWQKYYDGYTISSVFVWVVKHECSWDIIEGQLWMTKHGPQLVTPQHVQSVITVSKLYAPLGWQLEVARGMMKGKKWPHKELLMTAHEG